MELLQEHRQSLHLAHVKEQGCLGRCNTELVVE